MPDKNEKARRKEILRSQRVERRKSVREGLPIPATKMKLLFDYVDEHVSASQCDHTLRFAREYLKVNGLPEQEVLAWLESAGGHCDCEAIDNSEELLEDAMIGDNDD